MCVPNWGSFAVLTIGAAFRELGRHSRLSAKRLSAKRWGGACRSGIPFLEHPLPRTPPSSNTMSKESYRDLPGGPSLGSLQLQDDAAGRRSKRAIFGETFASLMRKVNQNEMSSPQPSQTASLIRTISGGFGNLPRLRPRRNSVAQLCT